MATRTAPPRIRFGLNLGFANFVWSLKETVRLVRSEFDIRHVQVATDLVADLPRFLQDRDGFIAYHEQVGRYAKRQGVTLASVFAWYRDSYSIIHQDPAFRKIGFQAMQALLLQAGTYFGTGHDLRCAGGIFGTMLREDYAKPSLRKKLTLQAVKDWKQLMAEARSYGIPYLSVEQMSILRELPATLEQARGLLDAFGRHHRKHPDTTSPLGLTLDTGHAVSTVEGSAKDRDYTAWFKAFPSSVPEMHLKNTDRGFMSTWPFTARYAGKGTVDPAAVFTAIRDYITQPEIMVFLEISGKRGREQGEREILADISRSIETVRAGLKKCGYHETRDHRWEA